jgi:hypothetical protein
MIVGGMPPGWKPLGILPDCQLWLQLLFEPVLSAQVWLSRAALRIAICRDGSHVLKFVEMDHTFWRFHCCVVHVSSADASSFRAWSPSHSSFHRRWTSFWACCASSVAPLLLPMTRLMVRPTSWRSLYTGRSSEGARNSPRHAW